MIKVLENPKTNNYRQLKKFVLSNEFPGDIMNLVICLSIVMYFYRDQN